MSSIERKINLSNRTHTVDCSELCELARDPCASITTLYKAPTDIFSSPLEVLPLSQCCMYHPMTQGMRDLDSFYLFLGTRFPNSTAALCKYLLYTSMPLPPGLAHLHSFQCNHLNKWQHAHTRIPLKAVMKWSF